MLVIKIYILYLLYAKRVFSKRFISYIRGLRLGDLWSFLKALFAEGLSPDVTLISFPRKQYVSVSFFEFLFCPLKKEAKNPSSDQPLSTRSVIKGTGMVLTDGIKIGSIVRKQGVYRSFLSTETLITDRVAYIY